MIITQPIAMAQIENKIIKHQYQNLKELGQDVTLLATNARTYNEDGSLLYQDANAIQVRPPTRIADMSKS
jgi:ATP-dependent helicase STH1/SNF2